MGADSEPTVLFFFWKRLVFSPLIVAILDVISFSAALPFVRFSYSSNVIYLIGGLHCR